LGRHRPGVSWPVEYRATWLPIFAIGCFTHEMLIAAGPGEIIRRDWRAQLDGWGQERFAYVLDNGIIGEAEVLRWADEVWGSGEPEEEDE